MISRLVRYQLVAFVLVTVIGVTYAAVEYVDLPRLLGVGRFSVTMDLTDSGGIYPNAVVTYRGNDVGRVETVDLAPGGVEVEMKINNDAQIPTPLRAEVRSTSAIGEQYVNLEPTGGGPPLADGSRIPVSETVMPTTVATLLSRVNTLAATLPKKDLNTVLFEADQAFSNTGNDLQRLLDSAGPLLDAANANFGPTVKLLQDLQPVLATQDRTRAQIALLTGNLAQFTDTTRALDPDIRAAVDQGAPFANELDALVNQIRPSLPILLQNLANVGQVTTMYLNSLREVLVVFPIATNQIQGAFNGSPVPGSAGLFFKLTVNDPPPCTQGFLDPSKRRDPNDLAPVDVPSNVYCRSGQKSDIGVRMAQNYDCPPGSPAGAGGRSPDARGCGLNFQTPQEEQAKRAFNTAVQTCVAAKSMPRKRGDPFVEPPENSICSRTAPYPALTANGTSPTSGQPPSSPDNERHDALGPPTGTARYVPGTGTAVTPDGRPFVVGDVVPPKPGLPAGLATFLVGPLM
jgi:phospholipid/cholesterol/gamma-HCH transport system substrate-binding protein